MLARPQRLFWSALFSAAVAVGCAAAFSQTKYAYEGKLLYVPNSVTAPYYESPALGSLVQVVVSPKLIGQLRDELALPEDVGDLRRSIRFDVSEADTLTISTARPSESEAKDTVDRLMERFVAEARRVRDAALTQFVADFATNVATARADYDQAIESQQQFLGEHQLETPGDVLAGVTMLQQAAAELELALENARSELSAVTAKRNHMRVALQQENDRIVANKPVVDGESPLRRSGLACRTTSTVGHCCAIAFSNSVNWGELRRALRSRSMSWSALDPSMSGSSSPRPNWNESKASWPFSKPSIPPACSTSTTH